MRVAPNRRQRAAAMGEIEPEADASPVTDVIEADVDPVTIGGVEAWQEEERQAEARRRQVDEAWQTWAAYRQAEEQARQEEARQEEAQRAEEEIRQEEARLRAEQGQAQAVRSFVDSIFDPIEEAQRAEEARREAKKVRLAESSRARAEQLAHEQLARRQAKEAARLQAEEEVRLQAAFLSGRSPVTDVIEADVGPLTIEGAEERVDAWRRQVEARRRQVEQAWQARLQAEEEARLQAEEEARPEEEERPQQGNARVNYAMIAPIAPETWTRIHEGNARGLLGKLLSPAIKPVAKPMAAVEAVEAAEIAEAVEAVEAETAREPSRREAVRRGREVPEGRSEEIVEYEEVEVVDAHSGGTRTVKVPKTNHHREDRQKAAEKARGREARQRALDEHFASAGRDRRIQETAREAEEARVGEERQTAVDEAEAHSREGMTSRQKEAVRETWRIQEEKAKKAKETRAREAEAARGRKAGQTKESRKAVDAAKARSRGEMTPGQEEVSRKSREIREEQARARETEAARGREARQRAGDAAEARSRGEMTPGQEEVSRKSREIREEQARARETEAARGREARQKALDEHFASAGRDRRIQETAREAEEARAGEARQTAVDEVWARKAQKAAEKARMSDAAEEARVARGRVAEEPAAESAVKSIKNMERQPKMGDGFNAEEPSNKKHKHGHKDGHGTKESESSSSGAKKEHGTTESKHTGEHKHGHKDGHGTKESEPSSSGTTGAKKTEPSSGESGTIGTKETESSSSQSRTTTEGQSSSQSRTTTEGQSSSQSRTTHGTTESSTESRTIHGTTSEKSSSSSTTSTRKTVSSSGHAQEGELSTHGSRAIASKDTPTVKMEVVERVPGKGTLYNVTKPDGTVSEVMIGEDLEAGALAVEGVIGETVIGIIALAMVMEVLDFVDDLKKVIDDPTKPENWTRLFATREMEDFYDDFNNVLDHPGDPEAWARLFAPAIAEDLVDMNVELGKIIFHAVKDVFASHHDKPVVQHLDSVIGGSPAIPLPEPKKGHVFAAVELINDGDEKPTPVKGAELTVAELSGHHLDVAARAAKGEYLSRVAIDFSGIAREDLDLSFLEKTISLAMEREAVHHEGLFATIDHKAIPKPTIKVLETEHGITVVIDFPRGSNVEEIYFPIFFNTLKGGYDIDVSIEAESIHEAVSKFVHLDNKGGRHAIDASSQGNILRDYYFHALSEKLANKGEDGYQYYISEVIVTLKGVARDDVHVGHNASVLEKDGVVIITYHCTPTDYCPSLQFKLDAPGRNGSISVEREYHVGRLTADEEHFDSETGEWDQPQECWVEKASDTLDVECADAYRGDSDSSSRPETDAGETVVRSSSEKAIHVSRHELSTPAPRIWLDQDADSIEAGRENIVYFSAIPQSECAHDDNGLYRHYVTKPFLKNLTITLTHVRPQDVDIEHLRVALGQDDSAVGVSEEDGKTIIAIEFNGLWTTAVNNLYFKVSPRAGDDVEVNIEYEAGLHTLHYDGHGGHEEDVDPRTWHEEDVDPRTWHAETHSSVHVAGGVIGATSAASAGRLSFEEQARDGAVLAGIALCVDGSHQDRATVPAATQCLDFTVVAGDGDEISGINIDIMGVARSDVDTDSFARALRAYFSDETFARLVLKTVDLVDKHGAVVGVEVVLALPKGTGLHEMSSSLFLSPHIGRNIHATITAESRHDGRIVTSEDSRDVEMEVREIAGTHHGVIGSRQLSFDRPARDGVVLADIAFSIDGWSLHRAAVSSYSDQHLDFTVAAGRGDELSNIGIEIMGVAPSDVDIAAFERAVYDYFPWETFKRVAFKVITLVDGEGAAVGTKIVLELPEGTDIHEISSFLSVTTHKAGDIHATITAESRHGDGIVTPDEDTTPDAGIRVGSFPGTVTTPAPEVTVIEDHNDYICATLKFDQKCDGYKGSIGTFYQSVIDRPKSPDGRGTMVAYIKSVTVTLGHVRPEDVDLEQLKRDLGSLANLSVSERDGATIITMDARVFEEDCFLHGKFVQHSDTVWGLGVSISSRLRILFRSPHDHNVEVGIEYEAGMAEVVNFRHGNEGCILDTTRTWHGETTGSICRGPDGWQYQAEAGDGSDGRHAHRADREGDDHIDGYSLLFHQRDDQEKLIHNLTVNGKDMSFYAHNGYYLRRSGSAYFIKDEVLDLYNDRVEVTTSSPFDSDHRKTLLLSLGTEDAGFAFKDGTGGKDITRLVTDNVRDMNHMFAGASGFNQAIGDWDVSNVRDMGHMFAGATGFNRAVGGWDVSNVRNMSHMFAGASVFNQDIGGWDVSNVRFMDHMFAGARDFDQDIGRWDVSNVRDMNHMFAGARDFNQDIGGWDVSNVRDMSWMFRGVTGFNQGIGDWDVSKVEHMSGMFSRATGFNQDIGDWDVSNVRHMNWMFCGVTGFNQDIGDWDVSKVEYMSGMFYEATGFNQNIGGWDVSNVRYMDRVFDKSGLSTENYDRILGGWSDIDSARGEEGLQKGVTLGADDKTYTDATARWHLTHDWNWNVDDGGLARTFTDKNGVYGNTGAVYRIAVGDSEGSGGAKNDKLNFRGHSENYIIHGLDGDDRITGGSGNDRIVGGDGDDTLTGGAGRDTFVYGYASEGHDHITDFNRNEDVIDISRLLDATEDDLSERLGDFVKVVKDDNGHVALLIDADGREDSMDRDQVFISLDGFEYRDGTDYGAFVRTLVDEGSLVIG